MQRHSFGRRAVLGAAIGSALLGLGRDAEAEARAGRASLVARPPSGFVPLSVPGRVVRVDKSNTLVENGLWPKPEAATAMLERAMAELTGKADLGAAFARFVHPSETVAIKPNGIAGRSGATMAANKELVLAVVRGLVAAGVAPERITIYEQYPKFLAGTRVVDKDQVLAPEFPAGVRTSVHENKDATMESIEVAGKKTKLVRPFVEASCVINVSQFKDHSICGFTGAMKNITHGSIINPHDYHAHNASPQIAQLYAQDLVRSRVRLHLVDAYKVIYDEGPLDKNPKRRVPFEAVYASTDPVALDVLGWGEIEKLRRDAGLPTLADAGRKPSYLRTAGDLGLGVFDTNQIALRQVRI
jgi:uncharacterized protein (DUF362 family)